MMTNRSHTPGDPKGVGGYVDVCMFVYLYTNNPPLGDRREGKYKNIYIYIHINTYNIYIYI